MAHPENSSTPAEGQQMWGGRFAAKPSDVMRRINASIDIDRRMWREDILGSKAHATMLAAQGVITREDAAQIQAGLDEIAHEIETGAFAFKTELEDIHLNIESRLTEKIGEAGKRLHTARSRNDQVATDFKLWTAGALQEAAASLVHVQRVLVTQADAHHDWIMPGFTHLQTAQPITLGHHLLAYVEMAHRDRERLWNARLRTLDGCPLGAAALAGTGYSIDRGLTATMLGFAAPSANSLDAVSSRDFAIEALGALSIATMHLSRLAEEIVLWTSPQFGFARLSDAWSTGSSIMPQKRNPDAAELVRAKAAQIAARHQALLGVMKALPLAYAKDMQDDKSLTFASFDDFALCAASMAGMMETIRFDRAAMRAAAARGFSTATDLADWLVRALGLPFREAHHVTGAVVKRAEQLGFSDLSLLPLGEMQKIEPRITQDALLLLSVENSVASRQSYGGAAPVQVRAQVARWKEILQ
jgi:argininosuccinate lyase